MLDVRALQTTHGEIIDLADPDFDQFKMWQVPSNLSNTKHSLVMSNDPFFMLRGYTQRYFHEQGKDFKKLIAVDFFIPTTGYSNFDSGGNLVIDWSLRDQQLEFLISFFENFEDINKDLVLSFCDESPQLKDILETLYSLMALYDIPEHRIIIMGHNFAGQEIINQYAKDNGEVPLKYIVAWWMLGHLNCDHVEKIVQNKQSFNLNERNSGKHKLQSVDMSPKQNTFIFLNRRETGNRLALAWLLWERTIKAYHNIISVCPPLRLFGIDPNRPDKTDSEGEIRNHYTEIFFQTLFKNLHPEAVSYIDQDMVNRFIEEMRVGKTLPGDHMFIGDTESKHIPQDNDAYIWLTCESTSELAEKNLFFTEKVLKPMVYGQALVVFAQPGFLKAFKQLGFYTLADDLGIDESYDDIENDAERLKFIADQMEQISTVPLLDLHQRYLQCEQKIKHNKKMMFSMLSNINNNFIQNQSEFIVNSICSRGFVNTSSQALEIYKNLFNLKLIEDN